MIANARSCTWPPPNARQHVTLVCARPHEAAFRRQRSEEQDRERFQYNQVIGHGLKFHHPDWTWERINIGVDMANETFRELVSLCRASGRASCSEVANSSQIESIVERFVSYKPELTSEVTFGKCMVANAIAAGYNAKVNILNSYLRRQGSTRLPIFARPLRLTSREQAEQNLSREQNRRLLSSGSAPRLLDDPDQ
ncbi:MAG TPA: hypothetical protein VLV78_05300 [Thermoanaerobaculia bacterium]|nr:hypothetical protein [Thermoanaerobaculia bacterium]